LVELTTFVGGRVTEVDFEDCALSPSQRGFPSVALSVMDGAHAAFLRCSVGGDPVAFGDHRTVAVRVSGQETEVTMTTCQVSAPLQWVRDRDLDALPGGEMRVMSLGEIADAFALAYEPVSDPRLTAGRTLLPLGWALVAEGGAQVRLDDTAVTGDVLANGPGTTYEVFGVAGASPGGVYVEDGANARDWRAPPGSG